MKAFITSILLFLVCELTVCAQTSNLVIFSDEGLTFTVYVNGQQINASPQSNVKKSGITGEGVKVRIVFAKTTPELSKYVMLTQNEETTLSIVKNKKGEYTFRMVSSAPISSNNHPVIIERNAPTVVSSNSGNTNTTTTIQTTTVNQGNMNTGMTMNSNVGMPVVNANISVNINANIQDPTLNSTTTTTTTTTSSSNSSYNGNNSNNGGNSDNGYWESCELGNGDYESACNSIRSKSFSDAKMIIAKQVLKSNCVNTSQVKGMAQLFDFEEDKLTFVKFAYDYTLDKNNYYKINDVFTYEITIEELNKYLDTKN